MTELQRRALTSARAPLQLATTDGRLLRRCSEHGQAALCSSGSRWLASDALVSRISSLCGRISRCSLLTVGSPAGSRSRRASRSSLKLPVAPASRAPVAPRRGRGSSASCSASAARSRSCRWTSRTKASGRRLTRAPRIASRRPSRRTAGAKGRCSTACDSTSKRQAATPGATVTRARRSRPTEVTSTAHSGSTRSSRSTLRRSVSSFPQLIIFTCQGLTPSSFLC